VATYYGYDAIFGTQSLLNGGAWNYAYGPANGDSWSYSGGQTSFHVREANDNNTRYNGDAGQGQNGNEVIPNSTRFGSNNEQLACVDGTYYQTIWDYNFSVTDGTSTWRVGVIDIDFNSNDFIDLDTENGYYLVFPDGVPPPGSYTVTGTIDNSTSTPHATLGGQIVCFAEGTLIETPRGRRPVEVLAPGDMVTTLDAGAQRLRWHGWRKVPATGALAPVRFATGALGNDRALIVSPQHRMLVSGWRAELFFGAEEVLVQAKDLVNGDTITRARGGEVTYHHILFDRHAIVFAEGVASESFQPGAQAQASVDSGQLAGLRRLHPDLAAAPRAARPSLKGFEASLLAA
jgi:Hint domain